MLPLYFDCLIDYIVRKAIIAIRIYQPISQTAYHKKAVTYHPRAKILSCQASEPHQQVQHCPLLSKFKLSIRDYYTFSSALHTSYIQRVLTPSRLS